MRLVVGISLISFLFLSCGSNSADKEANDSAERPSKENYLKAVRDLEDQALNDSILNESNARKLVKAYSDYSFGFPSDSLAPEFLFKAAEVATAIREYKQAIVYYETIVSKYPNYKYSVISLYLQGHIYDSFLNDDEKAKEIYETVIRSYPDHKFAQDAKIQIQNLGKTDEELIEEFKKKNQKANS